MELSDTVKLMCSNDYKERFIGEYVQLVIRTRKLQRVIAAWNNGTLTFKPASSYSSLCAQFHTMCTYRELLIDRAAQEAITLPKI